MDPRFGPVLGTDLSGWGWVSVYSTPNAVMHRAQHAMLGPDRGGEGLATGSRWTALRPVGGTCPSEEILPQGKGGSPRSTVRMREGGDRLREPNAARRLECPVRCGSAPQGALDLADLESDPPKAVRQDLSLWARTGGAERRLDVGHIRAANCRHPTSLTSRKRTTFSNY